MPPSGPVLPPLAAELVRPQSYAVRRDFPLVFWVLAAVALTGLFLRMWVVRVLREWKALGSLVALKDSEEPWAWEALAV